MPEVEVQTRKGGRSRPPLSRAGRYPLITTLSAVAIAFASLSSAARPRQAGEIRRPNREPRIVATPPGALRPGEIRARKLMKMMLKPTQQYVGVQETTIYGGSGVTSEQDIEGDTDGFVRITFRSPVNVEGDVMIIAPNSFHSYHRASRTLEVAPWPTEWNDEGKRMFANLLNGAVNARMNGTETVADRSAGIVVLTVPAGVGRPGRILRKLWIDEQTGILLKIQKSNAQGQITSVTTMTSITVNPAVPINPNDFKPQIQFPGATITPLFPEPQYRTIQDAMGHLPFTPAEPAAQSLPVNFQLDGVWGFGEDRAHPYLHSVLLRFTDGVASFSLYERLVPPAKQAPIQTPLPRSFGRSQQMWRVQTPQGEMNVQYIGHLTRQQAAAVYESLH